jgi:hypothetical protein
MVEEYRVCNSCGNYFLVTEDNKESIYCSKECYKEYIRCSICGSYIQSKDIIKSNDIFYCNECSKNL